MESCGAGTALGSSTSLSLSGSFSILLWLFPCLMYLGFFSCGQWWNFIHLTDERSLKHFALEYSLRLLYKTVCLLSNVYWIHGYAFYVVLWTSLMWWVVHEVSLVCAWVHGRPLMLFSSWSFLKSLCQSIWRSYFALWTCDCSYWAQEFFTKWAFWINMR